MAWLLRDIGLLGVVGLGWVQQLEPPSPDHGLQIVLAQGFRRAIEQARQFIQAQGTPATEGQDDLLNLDRSEERRVGKECRARREADQEEVTEAGMSGGDVRASA